VPAAPANCYVDDDFNQQIWDAQEALNTEIKAQTELNAQVEEEFHNMDGMEQAQRMQAFMMENPEKAMEYMQAQQEAGQSVTADVTASQADSQKLDADLARASADFDTAIKAAEAPVQARIDQLLEQQSVTVPTEAGDMTAFTSAAAAEDYKSLIDEENAAYEQVCHQYFGNGGAFAQWLAAYKQYVLDDVIRPNETMSQAQVQQYAIMDTDAGGYRSTAAAEGVVTYMGTLSRVYGLRKHKIAPMEAMIKES